MQLTAIARIGLLLTIKESYLLVKNSLGLIWHPIKTLRSLAREKDRSQQLLVIGLPLWIFGGGLATIWLGRRLLATTPEWGFGAKGTLMIVGTVTAILLVYLGYWLIKIKNWNDER